MPQLERVIVDQHEQLCKYACVPSAVELVLKLRHLVTQDYYGEQDAWRNRRNGGFADYDGKAVGGLRFERLFGDPRGPGFPFADLQRRISAELSADRFVAISLANPNGCHVYVIHGEFAVEFHAISKHWDRTLDEYCVWATVKEMGGTDILVYGP